MYVCISGCCSVPRADSYKQLYSYTKEEKTTKGKFGFKTKATLIKDFRENEAFAENITALKEKVEKYISTHTDLNELTKNYLRELKVTEGATKEEVKLLLGEPDKVIKPGKKDGACETWIYATSKRSTFTVIFLPVFFGHEKHYLYFKDDILTLIERHYLEQVFSASDSNMGLMGSSKK
jgi:hypothetical protein